MRIIAAACPYCGAGLEIDLDNSSVICPYCGQSVILEEEEYRTRISDAEQLGYLMERGRQRAIEEQRRSMPPAYQHQQRRPVPVPPVAAAPSGYYSDKSRGMALILAIFLGPLGGHQFYVGRAAKGVLYLFTYGLFGIGWIYDIIVIISGKFRDSRGRLLR